MKEFRWTCTYSLEVVSHLELILLVGKICLDLRVGVVDDGQEHVEQNEEDEEHIEDEVEGSEHTIGCLQLVEVEVTKDDTEQGEPEGEQLSKNHKI